MLDIRDLFVRMDAYASRFDSAGKPQHAEVIRGWTEEIKAITEKDALRADLLKELLDAHYEVNLETNAIFCGTKEQTAAYVESRPAQVRAAKERLEAAWRKADREY